MFRLATKDDYEFIPELGLWELTFDKRPVQGVRCDDPETGAKLYNQSRMRLEAVRRAENSRKKRYRIMRTFSWDEVFDWCLTQASPSECRLMLNLYHSPNSTCYRINLNRLRASKSLMRETNFYPFLGLILEQKRMVSAEYLTKLKEKAAQDET
ncbi:hypothetical protein FTH31_23590 [Salmonella enterica]|nr:hypothetical protein [Salmonella enterica]